MKDVVRNWIRTRAISPAGFLACAAAPAAVFAILHLAGLRMYAGVLSGTDVTEGLSRDGGATRGGIYVLAYFGCVVVAPILVIAAAIFAGLNRIIAPRSDYSPKR